MWLTIDIGNSAVKGGFFRDGDLIHAFRLDRAAATSWSAALHPHLRDVSVLRIGLASVVPSLTGPVEEALYRETGLRALRVAPSLHLPLTLAYQTPDTLGMDRLAAAVAAWTRHGKADRPVVALDAGTAVTYDVVDRHGVYRGGPIGAGPGLLRSALSRDTAQLPDVPFALPEEPIGRSTREALQSGLMYGFLDGVAGMLTRIARRLDAPPLVVATGGWASFLGENLKGIDHIEPHLVLFGIYHLMTCNPCGSSSGATAAAGCADIPPAR